MSVHSPGERSNESTPTSKGLPGTPRPFLSTKRKVVPVTFCTLDSTEYDPPPLSITVARVILRMELNVQDWKASAPQDSDISFE